MIDRKDEVGGVAGGAAGIGEGALVDLDDVLPAELGQMPHYGVADDAGADHDYSSADREFTHLTTPTFLGGVGNVLIESRVWIDVVSPQLTNS